MRIKSSKRCATCRFFSRPLCHRFPPHGTQWSTVQETNWCGEWVGAPLPVEPAEFSGVSIADHVFARGEADIPVTVPPTPPTVVESSGSVELVMTASGIAKL